MSVSRTSKSIKNSAFALGFYFVNLILQFFSRKIFLEYLGTEILGLNTTAMNLLQFLNIAELGISVGISFSLFKPLHNDDHETINEIITLQGQLYKRIALLICVGGAVLMCFFPIIFGKMQLPLIYAYASFGVLLFSSILSYFFNYKQVILTASQQDYKVLFSYKAIILLKILTQMFAVQYFSNGYIWWLVLEVIYAMIATVSLHITTIKNFPFLRNSSYPFNHLRKKYPEITIKIKQLFFHKIGGFALTQSSPLIIYGFTTLTTVALYGNYLIITTGILALLNAIFNSIGAGIGNLVAEGDKGKQLSVFYELFSVRYVIVFTACFIGYLIIPHFITLWIGKQYLLPDSTLILMLTVLFLNSIRATVDSFLTAYGLFSDIWSPVAEATINISLSVIFGYLWGLNGVLLGVISSLIIIIGIWKPYYLFSNAFNGGFTHYIIVYLKHIIATLFAVIIVLKVVEKVNLDVENWGHLLINSISDSLIFVSVLVLFMILFRTKILQFFYRIKSFSK